MPFLTLIYGSKSSKFRLYFGREFQVFYSTIYNDTSITDRAFL